MILAQYVLRDGCYLPGEVRTAIITKKSNDGENLDLTVFVHPDDFPSDHAACRKSLLQVNNVPHDENKSPGTWHYLTISTPAVEESPEQPTEEQIGPQEEF